MTRRPRGLDCEIRTPPRLGNTGIPESPFPASPQSLSPVNTVTYLAGTPCSQGSRDTRRSGAGRPVSGPPLSGAPSGTGSRDRSWAGSRQTASRASVGVLPTSPTAAGEAWLPLPFRQNSGLWCVSGAGSAERRGIHPTLGREAKRGSHLCGMGLRESATVRRASACCLGCRGTRT